MKYQPLGKHKNFSCIPHQQMVARLETIPLEESLRVGFYNLFRSWSNSNGPKWSVERTKLLRDCIMQSVSSNQLSNKPEWMATTKSGNLSGIPGRLYNKAFTSTKGLRSVLNLLAVYTVWKQVRIEDDQLTDIHNTVSQQSIVGGDTGYPGAKVLRKLKAVWFTKGQAFNTIEGLKRPSKVKCKKCVPITQVLPGKRSHVNRIGIEAFELRNSMPYSLHPEPINQAMGGEMLEDEQTALMIFLEQHEDFFSANPGSKEAMLASIDNGSVICRIPATNSNLKKDLVGKVNYTFEPGLKLRFYADPNVILQRALEPLKDGLFRIVKRVPWDCTHNQRKADSAVIAGMRRGELVHTIDMSKATDNFPWEYQKHVLRMVTNSRDENTRELVCLMISLVERGMFQLSSGRSIRRCRWNKGQPLGLGPSFPLFTLTHGLVLYALNEGNWSGDFYVLGDDVIILNDGLAARYKKWLHDVGVPISQAKSFSSSRIGQFAGKTFTPQGAFWTPKWQEVTQDNVLDCCAWWFPGLSRYFSKDRKTIDRVLSLPQPYGNGWNPEGLSLDERLSDQMVLNILEREDERLVKARPTSTKVSLEPLRAAMRARGFNDDTVLSALHLSLERDRAISYPTRVESSVPSLAYSPGTEVPGYPSVRFNERRVDPYSFGMLSYWKSIMKVAT